jgi:hypothetical protein
MSLYNFFPELNYYFYNYWMNYGKIVSDFIFIPESYDLTTDNVIEKNSLFSLLFNRSFSSEEYYYLFDEITLSDLPRGIKERIGYSGSEIHIYQGAPSGIMGSTSENILNLQTDDLMMMDLLLQYRIGNMPSLVGIYHDNLSTTISKLIYRYLDFKLNANFSWFNTNTLISDQTNIVEVILELYILNEVHLDMESWQLQIDAGVIKYRAVRQRQYVTDPDMALGRIYFCYLPNTSLNWYVTIEGELQSNSNFEIKYLDSTSGDLTCHTNCYIEWGDLVDIATGYIIILDYYSHEPIKYISGCACYPNGDVDAIPPE